MSEERDSPDVATEEATPTPAKASKPTAPRRGEDAETRRARQANAIKCIHPRAKNFPGLLTKVKALITAHSLSSKWGDSYYLKRFMGWSEFANIDDHPKLDMMLATMAIRDYFDTVHSGYESQITARNLREWLNEQLKVPTQSESAPKPTAREKTRVKTEPGADTIRASIEDDTGLKRLAHGHSAEPSNKRANLGLKQTPIAPEPNNVGMFQPSHQRIVYRETGMQTDSYRSVEEASGSMRQATAALEEQFKVLQNHNGMLGNLMERVQFAPPRPANNVAHLSQQYQVQDMIPLQPMSRAPPGYYMDHNRDNGGHGRIFGFQ
ncbi:hypothetical protein ACHAPO_000062 [Fusarium lateritium]